MKKSKNRRTILSIALCFTVFCTVITLLSLGISISAEGKNDTSTVQDTSDSEIYVLREYNGTIGIFYKGELMMQSDITTNSLRASDQELVANGIYTDSYEDVLLLLEDFNS